MEIDWKRVKKVLIVRLRSIGDTVLTTPSLIALREFLPHARIDILLEDWVSGLLDGFDAVDNVIVVSKRATSKFKTALEIRREKYDVAFNLHGGTTATFFVRASGAKYRIGYLEYSYNFLYTDLLSSASEFWKRETIHSAEQQLALLGFAGVPVFHRPKTKLVVTSQASESLSRKLVSAGLNSENSKLAVIHPAAAFKSKQWAVEKFSKIALFLKDKGFSVVALGAMHEREILFKLKNLANIPVFHNFTLPEITALASESKVFVGNDSGIAHIAAAVETPSVVIFGSSNQDHWRPWTDSPNEIVSNEMPCQPCAGYVCKEFGEPKCIQELEVEPVKNAIDALLQGIDSVSG